MKPFSGIFSASILSAMSSDLRKYHFANQVWLKDYGSISQIRKTVLYLKKDLDVENDERHPSNFARSSLFWEDLDNKTKNNVNSAFILINRLITRTQGFQSGSICPDGPGGPGSPGGPGGPSGLSGPSGQGGQSIGSLQDPRGSRGTPTGSKGVKG